MPDSNASAEIKRYLKLEDGTDRDLHWRGGDLPVLRCEEEEDVGYVVKGLPLLGSIPLGYHRLALESPVGLAETLIIAAQLVDYRRVVTLRHRVLKELAQCCFDNASGRLSELQRFLEDNPVVADYARFRATQHLQETTWQSWPHRLRDGLIAERDYAEDIMRFHAYAQWLAHQPVSSLEEKGAMRGVGIYFDMPLGVHPDGYDVWREQKVFALGASARAPPDTFFTKGQDWGFPPLHPERLREQGYRYFIQCLRFQLRPDLGLLSATDVQSEYGQRKTLREASATFLRRKGWLQTPAPGPEDMLRAILGWLSTGPARLVLVNLEDLWLETQPQNVPGTTQERPNWSRKARFSLEEISQSANVLQILQAINSLRKPLSWRRMKEKEVGTVRYDGSLLTKDDLYLFNEGSHFHLYERLGAHPVSIDCEVGTYFAVWAPNAERVSVIGEFNGWNKESHPLRSRGQSGIWDGFAPGVGKGSQYKYHIASRHGHYQVDKADPLALYAEIPPRTASIVWDLDYSWEDPAWMEERRAHNTLDAPISIYEMHLGSWMRAPEEENRSLSYRELAPRLAEHVGRMGLTHVEFLPIMEHPFYGSWGYQTPGYFSATSRYGSPQDLMYLIDYLHKNGIGVILDWVPSHFPTDEHSIGYFDGTHLYEHTDPQKGFHPDWNSSIFNYGRSQGQSFLISSALLWLDKYHVDGLRVGWEKWTPKSDKLERRRCQHEEGSTGKIHEGVPPGSGEGGDRGEALLAGGRAPVVPTTIDIGVLSEAA